MKKNKLILLIWLIFPIYSHAKENMQKPSPEKDFSKHEIGISWGAFPTSGILVGVDFWMPASQMVNGRYSIIGGFTYPWFAHYDSNEWDGPNIRDEESGVLHSTKEHYSMQHYGCLTFNYQYHFRKKHSIGFTASWLGRYISNYTVRPHTEEVINAKGWDNIFTLCVNYRFTYYSKDAVSLYIGAHVGFAMGFIERKLLFLSEDRFYAMTGIQVTGFGIEAGKTHAFVSELGFDCQGLLKIGYRYKFNNR